MDKVWFQMAISRAVLCGYITLIVCWSGFFSAFKCRREHIVEVVRKKCVGGGLSCREGRKGLCPCLPFPPSSTVRETKLRQPVSPFCGLFDVISVQSSGGCDVMSVHPELRNERVLSRFTILYPTVAKCSVRSFGMSRHNSASLWWARTRNFSSSWLSELEKSQC